MKNRILYLVLLFVLPSITMALELKPFTTDGCSSFPNGTESQRTLWLECCVRHDLEYWKGGTYEKKIAADLSLEQCVANLGKPKIAKLMLAGVRVGGSPFFPTEYRWGYGWPYLRGYAALNEEEKREVKRQLEKSKLFKNHLFMQKNTLQK